MTSVVGPGRRTGFSYFPRVVHFRAVNTPRLARITLVLTLFLIAFGGFTRGSASGYGCEDRWPLCENGLLGGWLPRPEFHMVIEWSHRWLAAWVGLLAFLTLVAAWRKRRDDTTPAALAAITLAVITFQAWIGRAVVKNDLSADLVSLHLFISLTVAFLVTSVYVFTSREHARPSSPRWRRAVGSAAIGSLTVLLLGSLVHNQYFAGWPFMDLGFLPDGWSAFATIHWFHRLAAGLLLVGLMLLSRLARKQDRPPASRRMIRWVLWLYSANIMAGWLHVLTEVRSSLVVATHLGIAAIVTTLLCWEFFRSMGEPTQSSSANPTQSAQA